MVLVLAFVSGCTERGRAGYRDGDKRPKVIVGSDNYPPFNFIDENGAPTGIDVDLAREAFSRMGYGVEFAIIDWENKDELVNSGAIDCIWGSFSMDGREKKYKWAGSYMISRQVVAVTKISPIQRLRDLEGKLVAVQTTTKPEEVFMRGAHGRIPQVKKIYSMEDRELIYPMLGKGYVDAIAAHESAIRQYNHDFGMDYRILDEPLMTVGLGVAFAAADDRGIAEKLDATLKAMQDDGTTKKILAKYLGDAERYLEVARIGS